MSVYSSAQCVARSVPATRRPFDVRLSFRREGLRGYYKGLSPYLLHVTPNICIVFLVYEHMTHSLATTEDASPSTSVPVAHWSDTDDTEVRFSQLDAEDQVQR